MIAVITYRFIGETATLHCFNREEYESHREAVQNLVDSKVIKDFHAYECVEIEGAFK